MEIRPEGAKVLVSVDKVTFEQEGIIIIPQDARNNRQYLMSTGTVVAVGPGAGCVFNISNSESADDDMESTRSLRVGDHVWFIRYGGASFEYKEKGDERDLRIINDTDIMALVGNEITQMDKE